MKTTNDIYIKYHWNHQHFVLDGRHHHLLTNRITVFDYYKLYNWDTFFIVVYMYLKYEH